MMKKSFGATLVETAVSVALVSVTALVVTVVVVRVTQANLLDLRNTEATQIAERLLEEASAPLTAGEVPPICPQILTLTDPTTHPAIDGQHANYAARVTIQSASIDLNTGEYTLDCDARDLFLITAEVGWDTGDPTAPEFNPERTITLSTAVSSDATFQPYAVFQSLTLTDSFGAVESCHTPGNDIPLTLAWDILGLANEAGALTYSVNDGNAIAIGDPSSGSIPLTATGTTVVRMDARHANGNVRSEFVRYDAITRPSIEALDWDPTEVFEGVPAKLRWNIQNATEILVDNNATSNQSLGEILIPKPTDRMKSTIRASAGNAAIDCNDELTTAELAVKEFNITSVTTAEKVTETELMTFTITLDEQNAFDGRYHEVIITSSGQEWGPFTGTQSGGGVAPIAIAAPPAGTYDFTITIRTRESTPETLTTYIMPTSMEVIEKPVIDSFNVTPLVACGNTIVTANWSVQHATDIALITDEDELARGLQASDSITIPQNVSGNVRLIALNELGYVVMSAEQNIQRQPTVMTNFTANTRTINAGDAITLSWNVTPSTDNTITLTLTNTNETITETVSPEETITLAPLIDTTFTLSSTLGACDPVTEDILITVTPAGTVTVTENPGVTITEDFTLGWSLDAPLALSVQRFITEIEGVPPTIFAPRVNPVGSAFTDLIQNLPVGSFTATVKLMDSYSELNVTLGRFGNPANPTDRVLSQDTITFEIIEKPVIQSFAVTPPNACGDTLVNLTWTTNFATSTQAFAQTSTTTETITDSAGTTATGNDVTFTVREPTDFTLFAFNKFGYPTEEPGVISVPYFASGGQIAFEGGRTTIVAGDEATLTWSAVGSVNVQVIATTDGGEAIILSEEDSGSVVVFPLETTTYTLNYGGGDCPAEFATATLTVTPVTIDAFTSDEDAITRYRLDSDPDAYDRTRDNATLSWTVSDSFTPTLHTLTLTSDRGGFVTNDTTLTITPAAGVTTGTTPASPIPPGDTYQATITDARGRTLATSESLTVGAEEYAIITAFTATPTRACGTEAISFAWSTRFADQPGATVTLNGVTVTPTETAFEPTITGTQAFTLTTTNALGAFDSRTLTVTRAVAPTLSGGFSSEFGSGTPETLTVPEGAPVTFTYTVSEDATNITMDDVTAPMTNTISFRALKDTTIVIRAKNGDGPDACVTERTFTLTVESVNVNTLTVTPAEITRGEGVNVTFTTSGAFTPALHTRSLSFTPDTGTIAALDAATPVTFTPSGSGTLRLSITVPDDAGGTLTLDSSTERITVVPEPRVTNFTITPPITCAGSDVTIAWSTADTETVLLNGEGVPASGSVTRTITTDTAFHLTALNRLGYPSEHSLTARAAAEPTSSLTITPTNVTAGGTVTVTWVSTGGNTTFLNDDVVPANGSKKVRVTEDQAFTVTTESATCNPVTLTRSVNVNEVNVTAFTVNTTEVTAGADVSFTWSTSEFDPSIHQLRLTPSLESVTGTTALVRIDENSRWTLQVLTLDGVLLAESNPIDITVIEEPSIASFNVIPTNACANTANRLVMWNATGSSAVLATDSNASGTNVRLNDATDLELSGDGTVTLTVSNALGVTASSSAPFLTTNVPTGDITLSENIVPYGSVLEFDWVSDATATAVVLMDAFEAWPPADAVIQDALRFHPASASGSMSFPVTRDTRIVLIGSNDTGDDDCVTITDQVVMTSSPTIVSFEASATTVTAGGTTILSWVIDDFDPTTMVLTLDPTQEVLTGDDVTVTITESTQYRLVIRSIDGTLLTESDALTVTRSGEPTITFASIEPAFSCGPTEGVISWESAFASTITILGEARDATGTLTVPLPNSSTFTLKPSSATSVGATVALRAVVLDPPTVAVTGVHGENAGANLTVPVGTTVTLSWSSTNAHAVTLDGLPVTSEGERSVRVTGNRSFTFSALNDCGVDTRVVNVTVPEITGVFTSDRYVITRGENATLSWNLTNVDETLHDVWLEPLGVNVTSVGTLEVAPVDATAFTLVVRDRTNAIVGFINLPAPIDVVDPPTILSFATDTVTACGNTPANIFWSTLNASSVTLDDVPQANLTGGTSIALTSERTLTLTAVNAAGRSTQAVITIPHASNPSITVSTSSESVNVGESVTVSWVAPEDAVVRLNNSRVPNEGERVITITERMTLAFSVDTVHCGSVTEARTITITPVTITSFTTDRTRIAFPDDPVTLSWEVTGFDASLHALSLHREPLTNDSVPAPTPLDNTGSFTTFVPESSVYSLRVTSRASGVTLASTTPGITITLSNEAHITYLTATPPVVCGDGTARIDYFASNATNVLHSGSPLPTFGSVTVPITGTQAFTFTPVARANATAFPRSITIEHTNVSGMNFIASNNNVKQGEATVLSWEADGWIPDWVTVNDARVGITGAISVNPLSNTRYTLKAGTSNGCVTTEVIDVTVNTLAFGELTATPNPLNTNAFVTLELAGITNFDASIHELFLEGYGVIPSGGFGEAPDASAFASDLSDCLSTTLDSCSIPIGLTEPVVTRSIRLTFDGGSVWQLTNHAATLPESCSSTVSDTGLLIECENAVEIMDLGFLTATRRTTAEEPTITFDSTACVNANLNQTCSLTFTANPRVTATAFEINLDAPAAFTAVSFDSSLPSACEAAFVLGRITVACREDTSMGALGTLTLRKVLATSTAPTVTSTKFILSDLTEVTIPAIDLGRAASFTASEYLNSRNEWVDLTVTEGRVPEGIYYYDGVLTITMQVTESKRYQVIGRLRSNPTVTLTSSNAVVVTVANAPRIITFRAEPLTYCVGEQRALLLTWVTANANRVLLNGFDITDSFGVHPHHPTGNELTLTAQNDVGEASSSVLLTLGSFPRVSLTASPNPRLAGASSSVTWSTQHATVVTLDGESVGANGLTTHRTPTITTMALSGSNDCGTATHTLTLDVIPVTIESFTADTENLSEGESTTLRWTLGNSFNPLVHTVTLEPLGLDVTLSSQLEVTPEALSTYYLVITDAFGNTLHESSAVTITVDGAPAVVSFTAEPAFVCGSGEVSFAWRTRNATRVLLNGSQVTPSTEGTFSTLVNTTRSWELAAFDAFDRNDSSTLTIPVLAKPVIEVFTVTPSNPVDGASSITLAWRVTNATETRLDGTVVASEGTLVFTANTSRSFTLTARNEAGGNACVTERTLSVPVTPVTLSSVTLDDLISQPGTLSYRILPAGNFTAAWDDEPLATGVSSTNLSWIFDSGTTPTELTRLPAGTYRVEYTGYFYNPTAGNSTFRISSIYEYELRINENLILAEYQTGITTPRTTENTTNLPIGWIPITLRTQATNTDGVVSVTHQAPGATGFTTLPAEQLGFLNAERTITWGVSTSFDPALHEVRVTWSTPDRAITESFAGAGESTWFAGDVREVRLDIIRRRDGSVANTVTRNLTPTALPNIPTFTASPTSICSGSSVTASWVTTGGSTELAFTPDGGSRSVLSRATSSSSFGFVPAASGILTLTVTDAWGLASTRTTPITVTTAPTASITASPARIKAGESSTLSWVSTNADVTRLNNQVVTTSGTLTVAPSSTSTYTLTTTAGACSTVTRTATITVDAVSITNVTMTPPRITLGESSVLTWTNTNFVPGNHTVSISGAPATPSGNATATITPTTTGITPVTITITDEFDRVIATASTQVEVIAPAMVDSFTVTPASVCVTANGSTNVTAAWVTRNASSIQLNGTTVAPPNSTSDGNVPWRVTGSGTAGVTTPVSITITARNSLGATATESRTVNVTTIPTTTFTTDKETVTWGETITLSWTATESATVTLDGEVVPATGSRAVLMTETRTFELSVTTPGCNAVIERETVTVNQPIISSFAADRTNINPSDPTRRSSTLTWSTLHVNTLLHDVLLTPTGVNVTNQTSITVTPTTTTAFTLRVTQKNNSSVILTESTGITVTTSSDPVITSFTSSPTTACGTTDVILSWATANTSNVTLNGVTVTPAASGNVTRTITQPTTFNLTARNAAGTSVTESLTVAFATPPTTAFTASKTTINYGESITLSWSTSQATSVKLDDETVPTSGGITRSPTSTTTYQLTTEKTGCPSVITPVTVTVNTPSITGFAFTGDKDELGSVPENSSVTLAWGVTNYDPALHAITLNDTPVTGTTASGLVSTTTAFTLRIETRATPAVTLASSTITIPVRPRILSFTAPATVCVTNPTAALAWDTLHGNVTLSDGVNTTPLTTTGSTSRSILTDTTWVLTSTNAAGTTATATLTTTIAPAPTITLTATPPNPTPGGSFTLAWSTTNATTITLDGNPVAATGSMNVTAPSSAGEEVTFTLAASNDACGTITDAITVGTETNALTNLTATPNVITLGEPTVIAWELAPGVNLTDYRLAINERAAFGTSDATAPGFVMTPTETGVLTITATLLTRSTNAPVSTLTTTLTVAPESIINAFTVTPTSVCTTNPTVTLAWDTQHGVTREITGIGSVNAIGTRTLTPDSSTTWTLTVTNAANKAATATATATILNTPTITNLTNPTSIQLGESITITWVTTDTTTIRTTGDATSSTPATDDSLTITPNEAGAFTLSFTPENAGCTGETITRVITVTTTPDAPTNVSSNVTGDQRITITWEPPTSDGFTPITHYVIERRTNDLAWLPITTTGNVTTYTDTTVVAGNDYQYRIIARNANGDSAPSNPTTAIASIRAPASITCTLAPTRPNEIALAWVITATPERPITNFTLTGSDALADVTRTLPSSDRESTFTNLTAGEQATITITANNPAGNSSIECSTITLTTPGTPKDLTVTITNPNTLTSAWNAPDDTGGDANQLTYDLQISINDGAFQDANDTSNPSTQAFTAGDTITYRVRAKNPTGTSDWLTSAPTLVITNPNAPTNTTLTGGDATATATWTPATSSSTHPHDTTEIEWIINGNPQPTITTTTPATAPALTPGDTLTYRVRHTNTQQTPPFTSAWVNGPTITITTTPNTPSAPTLTITGEGSVRVTYNRALGTTARPAGTTYELQENIGAGWVSVYTGPSDTFNAANLTLGSTVQYRVRDISTIGPSAWSPAASITIIGVPNSVTNCTTTIRDGIATITWTTNTSTARPAESITVRRNGTIIHTSLTNTFTDTTATLGSTITYTLTATNAAGTSASVDCAAVTITTSPTSITNCTSTTQDTSLSFTWTGTSTSNAPITTYRIYRNATLTPEDLITETPNATAFLTNLTNGVPVSIWVQAIGPGGESAAVECTGTPAAAPASVTDCVAAPATAGALTVTWVTPASTPAAPINRTEVQYGTTTIDAATSPLTVNTPVGETTTFRIRTVGAGGTSDWVTCSGVSITAPPEPTECSVDVLDGGLRVSWVGTSSVSAPLTTARIRVTPAGGTDTLTTRPFTDATHDITNLTNGTQHVVKVAFGNAIGFGPERVCASTATPTVAPPAPDSCSVSGAGTNALRVDWVANTSNAFRIVMTPTAGATVTQDAASGTRSATVGGLQNEVPYVARVFGATSVTRFVNNTPITSGVLLSTSSAECSGTPYPVPTAVSTCTVTQTNPRELRVDWVAPANTASLPRTDFIVTRNGAVATQLAGNSFTDSLLNAGTLYEYAVIASGPGGDSAPSTVCSGPAIDVPNTPNVDVVVTPETTGGLTVSWTLSTSTARPNGSPASYEVERSIDRGTTWSVVSTTTATSVNQTNLTLGERYYYRIRARNAVGWSAWGEDNATAIGVPRAPGNLNVTATDSLELTATWSAPSRRTSNPPGDTYEIQRGPESDGPWTTLRSGFTAREYVDGDVELGPGYYYRVRNFNAAGAGDWTNPVLGIPLATPIAITSSSPTCSMASQTTISVGWQQNMFSQLPGNKPTSFEVEWQTNASISPKSGLLPQVSSLGATHTPTVTTVQYQYRVRGSNAVGTSAFTGWSSYCSLTTSLTTAPRFKFARPNALGRVKLEFTSVSGATGYDLEYQRRIEPQRGEKLTKAFDSPVSLGSLTGTSTNKTLDSFVTPSASGDVQDSRCYEYQFRVRAKNSAGPGPWSDWTTRFTRVPYAAPISLTGGTASMYMFSIKPNFPLVGRNASAYQSVYDTETFMINTVGNRVQWGCGLMEEFLLEMEYTQYQSINNPSPYPVVDDKNHYDAFYGFPTYRNRTYGAHMISDRSVNGWRWLGDYRGYQGEFQINVPRRLDNGEPVYPLKTTIRVCNFYSSSGLKTSGCSNALVTTWSSATSWSSTVIP